MAQSVRERTSELAVLKTLGFSSGVDPDAGAGRVAVHRALGGGARARRWRGCSCSRAIRPAACCRSSCCRRATSSIGVGLMVADGPARRRRCRPSGHAAEDHRRAEEELTMQLAHDRPSPSSRSTCARFRSGSARRRSPSSASPASSSCSCRCCRSPRVPAAMRGVGLARPRARDAQRRRQRDDERPRAARTSTSSSRRRASGATARRRSRRPSSTSSSTCRRSRRRTRRPTCRCAASSRPACRCATKSRSSKGRMFQFGTNEVDRRPRRQRTVRRASNVGDTIVVRAEPLEGRRHLRGRRRRRRDRDLVRRAHAAGRLPPRQHLSVGARAARLDRVASTRSATG